MVYASICRTREGQAGDDGDELARHGLDQADHEAVEGGTEHEDATGDHRGHPALIAFAGLRRDADARCRGMTRPAYAYRLKKYGLR